MSLSLTPDPTKPDLVYDLLCWVVATAKDAGGQPLFVNGEISDSTQQSGTFHILLEYGDDMPADAVVASQAPDEEQEEFVPLREASMEWLIRAQDRATIGSARARAKACSKALQELFRDSDQRNKTMLTLPSGRMVMAFKDIKDAAAGMDGSGQRFEYLLQFRVLYRDSLTQST